MHQHPSRRIPLRPRFWSAQASSLCAVAILLVSSPSLAAPQYPTVYVKDTDRAAIKNKVASADWAKEAYGDLVRAVEPYVSRHKRDPQWILSRMAMYWKPGERYTQVYLIKRADSGAGEIRFDRGEGDAPVPTVRLPGMRVWNEYINVPLEDRIPFNQTGDMKAVSRKRADQPPVIVPYKESGHLIRSNNVEILTLAEKAAFIYWLNGDPDYARFASDIFQQWLVGTYYMQPPLDPEQASGGPGGYAPGGILGYYDYEQIHDDLGYHGALIYDFLQPYLQDHPSDAVKTTGKSPAEVADAVFRRFVAIGFVRGGKTGNWNVNGWNLMLPQILVLKDDADYADGKGKQYYIRHFVTESSVYHDALPDILKTYDPATGLWPESPGYAFSVTNSLVRMSVPLENNGVDVLATNALLQKAALATFAWLDSRGNLIAFGDSRGGPADFSSLEALLAYYGRKGDVQSATTVASAIQAGVEPGAYKRNAQSWIGLVSSVDEVVKAASSERSPTSALSGFHRLIVQRNPGDGRNELMNVVYGGRKGAHLSENGLAAQFYGYGWALAPDAAGYESYWSADQVYHQSATGSNTIVQGYREGPVTFNALNPAVPTAGFVSPQAVSDVVSYVDVSAGEKRRLVATVRTGPATGFYVDLFRSNLDTNDYLFHGLGTQLALTTTDGQPIDLTASNWLSEDVAKGYKFLSNERSASVSTSLVAKWRTPGGTTGVGLNLWLPYQSHRTVATVDAPYTALVDGTTPDGAGRAPNPTPTLILRQEGLSGWDAPFASVVEPINGEKGSIYEVRRLDGDAGTNGVEIGFGEAGKAWVVHATKPGHYRFTDKSGPVLEIGQGFGAVVKTTEGRAHIFVGAGTDLTYGALTVRNAANSTQSFSLTVDGTKTIYSSEAPVTVVVHKWWFGFPKRETWTLPAGIKQPLPENLRSRLANARF
ncbi:hypothetical protein EM6_0832 [Asticcacaulis excentricus]|uniref:Uncharacterized protein n=1 Tax=Asticcacaulis excentricus TaxID=78587 RepID=A0A3G9G5A2_9CAUL|nr:hypothetical protein EM6_0832 [Asticcacaulis excentricus]